MSGALIVEIHDVSPLTWPAIQRIDRALSGVGIDQPALFIVPAMRGVDNRTHDVRRDLGFASWLRERVSSGCELIQHGLTHRAEGPTPLGIRPLLMRRVFSRGCNEFAHLTGRQARRRLLAGRQILADCGLEARGFVAPAWQQSPQSIAAVRSLGFAFTAFFDSVVPLAGARPTLRTPALTFDAPSGGVDRAKRLLMRWREAGATRVPLLRVALHPDDVRQRLEHIMGRIRALLERGRRLTSYRGFLSC